MAKRCFIKNIKSHLLKSLGYMWTLKYSTLLLGGMKIGEGSWAEVSGGRWASGEEVGSMFERYHSVALYDNCHDLFYLHQIWLYVPWGKVNKGISLPPPQLLDLYFSVPAALHNALHASLLSALLTWCNQSKDGATVSISLRLHPWLFVHAQFEAKFSSQLICFTIWKLH